jgi:hypothetical protein
MFVDEIEDAVIVAEPPWQTADNYTPHSNCIDDLELHLPP